MAESHNEASVKPRLYVIESRMKVDGARWTPWSSTDVFMSEAKAVSAAAHLEHKRHPVPSDFRVAAYERVMP